MQTPQKPSQAASRAPGSWSHTLLFLAFLAVGVLIYFTPIRNWLSQGEAFRQYLAGFGPAGPWVFGGLSALLTALGVPRLLLCSLAGMLFGFVEGMLWSQMTTLLGSYAVFLFARRFGRHYELKKFGKFSRFTGFIESNGILAVLVIRQLPMSGFYNNLFLGLTRIRQWEFLLGSFIGFLPLGVTACSIGAGLLEADLSKSLEYGVVGITVALVLGLILKGLRNMAKNQPSLDSALAKEE